jgi:serine/threonine protein kinase
VCDFGISKMKDATAASTTRAAPGTPAYMAPEAFEGRPLTDKVDVWAWGVLVWEACAGVPPWAGLSAMQIIYAVGLQVRWGDWEGGEGGESAAACWLSPDFWSSLQLLLPGSCLCPPCCCCCCWCLALLMHCLPPYQAPCEPRWSPSHPHQRERLPRPAGIPSALWALLTSCWAEDPASRPSFAELLPAVNQLLQEAVLQAAAQEVAAPAATGGAPGAAMGVEGSAGAAMAAARGVIKHQDQGVLEAVA